MAVERSLGVARGATGVAHARRRVFIQGRPFVGIGLFAHPTFVADQTWNATVSGQFVGVAQGHPMLDCGATRMDLLGNRQKRHVKAHDLVFGMVGNPHNLVRV